MQRRGGYEAAGGYMEGATNQLMEAVLTKISGRLEGDGEQDGGGAAEVGQRQKGTGELGAGRRRDHLGMGRGARGRGRVQGGRSGGRGTRQGTQ